MDAVLDRLGPCASRRSRSWTGFAMGSGLAISACCDLRVHAGREVRDADRRPSATACRWPTTRGWSPPSAGRVKDLIFTAGVIGAKEALAIGFATVVEDAESHVTELCERLADHSPTTMWVTKEALRRARVVPEGDDLVLEAYGSEGFRRNVARFLKQ